MAMLGWAWQLQFSAERHPIDPPQAEPNVSALAKQPSSSDLSVRSDLSSDKSKSPSHEHLEESIIRARQLIDQGRHQEALSLLNKLSNENPTDTSILMEIAVLHILDLKDSQSALPILEQIVTIQPDHRAAIRELEVVYRELNHNDEGRDFVLHMTQRHPDSMPLQLLYGKLIAEKNPQASITWFQNAATDPELHEEALDLIVSSALASHNRNLARETLQKSLRISENRLEHYKKSDAVPIDFLEDRIAATKKKLQEIDKTF
jgi:predicted Zn-dependent protease